MLSYTQHRFQSTPLVKTHFFQRPYHFSKRSCSPSLVTSPTVCFAWIFTSSADANRVPWVGIWTLGIRRNLLEQDLENMVAVWQVFRFCELLARQERPICWCIVMMKNPILSLPQIGSFSFNCSSKIPKNCNIVPLLTFWPSGRTRNAQGLSNNISSITILFDRYACRVGHIPYGQGRKVAYIALSPEVRLI